MVLSSMIPSNFSRELGRNLAHNFQQRIVFIKQVYNTTKDKSAGNLNHSFHRYSLSNYSLLDISGEYTSPGPTSHFLGYTCLITVYLILCCPTNLIILIFTLLITTTKSESNSKIMTTINVSTTKVPKRFKSRVCKVVPRYQRR